MGTENKLKKLISRIAFSVYLWAEDMTEDEFWREQKLQVIRELLDKFIERWSK